MNLQKYTNINLNEFLVTLLGSLYLLPAFRDNQGYN